MKEATTIHKMRNRKVNIGIVSGYPITPNMNAYLYNLGRLVEEEFRLDLVVGEKKIPKRITDYYHIYRTASFPFDVASLGYALTACTSYLSRRSPDLFMNIGQSVLGLAVSWTGMFADVQTVVRYPGEAQAAGLGRSLWEKYKSQCLQGRVRSLAFQSADGILVNGRKPYDEFLDQGVPPDKMRVIPQPFDPSQFVVPEDKNKSRKKLNLETEKKVVLFVGRLSWLKGADRLTEIINSLYESREEYQFCIVGEGEYKRKLRHLPNKYVKTEGRVPHKKIAKYYNASDVLVFPSRTEGLPNVILEALSAGVPVIASPVGDIPNYVSHTANCIREFLELLSQDGLSTDPLPHHLEWKNLKSNYVNMLEDMLSR